MRILIDIQTIKGSFTYKGPIRIKIKLGDEFSLWTQYSHLTEGVYAFLQKHVIRLHQKSAHSYVELSIVGQDGTICGQITVFLDKFKEFTSIQIKRDKDIYKLNYSLREVMDDSEQIKITRRRTSIEQQHSVMKQQASKPQVLRLGILMYNFCQRLDPLIYVHSKLLAIISWKDPLYTLGIGFILTIIITYMKTSILIGSICLFFAKENIFKKISNIHRYKDIHKRIIVPPQNAFFIQQAMDFYCELYQKVSAFLFNHDKTLLVNLVKFICKTCIIIVFLLYLFSIESIFIIVVWAVLILNSPFSQKIKKFMKPTFNILIGEYFKIFDKISSGISTMIGNQKNCQQQQTQKIFYYYHYQRWWVVKGWRDETKKYSDQKYEAILIPRQRPPEGWAWTQQWKIDFQGDVDSEGYAYANDLNKEFNSIHALMTRRRRKWKRTCVKIPEGV